MLTIKESKPLFFIAVFSLFCATGCLSYLVPRENFWLSYGLMLVAFVSFYLAYNSTNNFKMLFWVGLGLRVLLLFSVPELSDDFYRFLWDGAVSESGHNPFLYKPIEIIDSGWLRDDFIDKFQLLNSPEYYTVYPSFIQLVDLVSVTLGRSFLGSMLVMKLFFLLAELCSFYFLKLLLKNKQSFKSVFLYWLFPLVIIEFVGNLHFEAFMVTFMLGCFYFLRSQKILLSALFFALSFHTKLIPLMFFPFVLMKTEKPVKFLVYSSVFLLLGAMPYIFDQAYLKIFESVKLYFGSFEFNSGIAYVGQIFRDDHLWVTIMIKAVFIGFLFWWLYFSFSKKIELAFSIGVIYAVYLLFSQSVHPWYVLPLLPIFLVYIVPESLWVWFVLIPLSYITYRTEFYEQENWVRIVEYGFLFVFIVIELVRKKGCSLVK